LDIIETNILGQECSQAPGANYHTKCNAVTFRISRMVRLRLILSHNQVKERSSKDTSLAKLDLNQI
jgi:hypothetical protein